jgi:hypothetical protein
MRVNIWTVIPAATACMYDLVTLILRFAAFLLGVAIHHQPAATSNASAQITVDFFKNWFGLIF